MNKSDADFAYTSVAMPSGGIFIPADEPLLVFPSIRAAERYIEVTDIETGVYSVAYGPRAEPYNITHVGKKAVVQSVAGSCRPDDLKPLLIRYLEAIGQNPNLDSSLDQLVKAVWDYERDFWAENDPDGDRFSKRVPVWGCLAALALMALAVFLILR